MDQMTVTKPMDNFTLCPKFEQTFSILGKKWNGLIIEVLLNEGTLRFKDLVVNVPKCSDRVLVERLKELEQDGIVARNTYDKSTKVDYSLTNKGLELRPVMDAVHSWGDKWFG
ncbi:HxlR family transcriptional regulator [Paucilactobacillus hokkaidonensis JCM 18461]|uniref:HxlR family transcriptional regulator n=2 Tax=Paucilactobacillus hokkaidonensis TaxID=1193095 RepID=A0A0A1GYC7_9LACO|nr:helix-turn-helix domain-containing protein [Paucilactobacillus hokkaidonensis]KRO08272.1 HxlR family transcriptional regulator [Paucilactobacillus hokkaidonensis]BAP85461.1 HxlR family transcriptional regulator [Paucilactobacillus hokkaidonensis JCM 18461]